MKDNNPDSQRESKRISPHGDAGLEYGELMLNDSTINFRWRSDSPFMVAILALNLNSFTLQLIEINTEINKPSQPILYILFFLFIVGEGGC